MFREEQARQGCLKRVCPRALSTDAYKWSQKVGLQGCIKSVTLNRCTMQRHKWLSLQDAATLMADEAVTHRPQTTTIAMDAKPTKHTQALALRKARGIVLFWKGWWSDNPSGSRPNFFRRQHLTFNKGGKCGGAGRGG